MATGRAAPNEISVGTSGLSDLEVRVEFLLENPPCREGQPPDILLKSALRAEKRPKIRVFSPRSGVPAACLKGRGFIFSDDFSCFKLRLHSKSDRLLGHYERLKPVSGRGNSRMNAVAHSCGLPISSAVCNVDLCRVNPCRKTTSDRSTSSTVPFAG